eukprot:COSAG02_NODE_3290_length_6997_cov_20.105973_4_plen_130_part_00
MGWDRHAAARKECDAKAARAAAARLPSKQEIRSKLRAHEGMTVGKRPQTASGDTTLGLTDTEEMMRLRAACVAARLRPKSADAQTMTNSSAARALLANSSDSVGDRCLQCPFALTSTLANVSRACKSRT